MRASPSQWRFGVWPRQLMAVCQDEPRVAVPEPSCNDGRGGGSALKAYLGPELSLEALDGRAPALEAATKFSPLLVSVGKLREDDPVLRLGSVIFVLFGLRPICPAVEQYG